MDEPAHINSQGVDNHGNQSCNYGKRGSKPRFDLMITPVPQEGADVWLREKRNADVRPTMVAGYGAVEAPLKGQSSICAVVVDVAGGQSLDVQFGWVSEAQYTREQTCQKAADAAALAVQTLQTLR